MSFCFIFHRLRKDLYLITSNFEKDHLLTLKRTNMGRLIMYLTGALILSLSGCSKYEIPKPECPEDVPTGLSFASDIQPIFDKNCAMCHVGGQTPDLSPGWARDELIDGGYVDTEFPCSSRLYEVFSATHGGRATEEEILTLLGWIYEGAKDN